MVSMSPKAKAEEFLKIAPQFKLGHLVTESFHPETSRLSSLVQEDVAEAHKILQAIDRLALYEMRSKDQMLWELVQDIQATLKAGNKIFLVGCGATGRLSLVLETLYRQEFGSTSQVVAFMAGGDFALIKSVESFEDRVDFGERQLMELGFGPNDLLLAPTEGGETPFVIGATNKAAEVSSRSPYFLYCNPDELLRPIERSREVIENPKIKKINLTVGPMAISGSTRMQASTVLMLGIGVGLLYEHANFEEFQQFYQSFLQRLTKIDYSKMADLTKLESRAYQEKKYLNYVADSSLAISILTDTTERSPTFSLRAFENKLEAASDFSLSYLFIPEARTSREAWNELLWRAPRALEWNELNGRVALPRIYGFDISEHGLNTRSSHIPTINFKIFHDDGKITFECQEKKAVFDGGEEPLFHHLMVKMLLNSHSTLIMGLLGRYEGNVMTWVRPSNNKLIDRAARYVMHLLKQKQKVVSYEEVVEKIFEEAEKLKENEPIVMKVLERF